MEAEADKAIDEAENAPEETPPEEEPETPAEEAPAEEAPAEEAPAEEAPAEERKLHLKYRKFLEIEKRKFKRH